MLTVSPGIKERFQRFQLVYHIRLMHEYEDILLGGFHIEEQVYGPKYYYPALDGWIKSAPCPPVLRSLTHPTCPLPACADNGASTRKYEKEIPQDSILVHLKASPDVIHQRMEDDPHDTQLVQPDEVEEVQALFAAQYADVRMITLYLCWLVC